MIFDAPPVPDELSPGVRRRAADVVARLRGDAADRLPLLLPPLPDGGPPPADGVPPGEEGPDPPRRRVPRNAAAAATVVAVLACGALLSRAALGGDAEVTTVPARTPVAAAGSQRASAPVRTASASATAALVVDVTGRVRRAGLVRLQAGARVWDAILAAGGPSPGAHLDRLNLARRVTDGEQVAVPGPGDPAVAAPPSGAGTGPDGAAPAVVDLNAATPEQLDTLPGVGPVLASRIVAWRTEHGRFSRVEELGEVAGIGDKLFAQLRQRVRV
jgi:competence protein ComEA